MGAKVAPILSAKASAPPTAVWPVQRGMLRHVTGAVNAPQFRTAEPGAEAPGGGDRKGEFASRIALLAPLRPEAGIWAVHGSNAGGKALIEDVHEAAAEDHDPRSGRVGRVGRRWPVVGRSGEGVQPVVENRIDRRTRSPVIHDALQLSDVRQPPVAVPCKTRPAFCVDGIYPRPGRLNPCTCRVHTMQISQARTRIPTAALFLPRQPCVEVGNRPVAIVLVSQRGTLHPIPRKGHTPIRKLLEYLVELLVQILVLHFDFGCRCLRLNQSHLHHEDEQAYTRGEHCKTISSFSQHCSSLFPGVCPECFNRTAYLLLISPKSQ